MAAELWRQAFQIGKESTYGTGVAATRIVYFDVDGSALSENRELTMHRFATGRRDNTLAGTQGPAIVGGTVQQPLSVSESLELLLMGLEGGVTPTGAGAAKTWVFTPGGTVLDSATLQWNDGAVAKRSVGVYANTLTIEGNVSAGNTLTAELFGKSLANNALTGSLTPRVPSFLRGWETKLYIDGLGGTPGTTNIPGALMNWRITFNNNLDRLFFADNVNTTGAITQGLFDVEASFLMFAGATDPPNEITNFKNGLPRLVRLEFGNNVAISGGGNEVMQVDIAGMWSAADLGQAEAGVRAYEFTFMGLRDSVNDFVSQVTVVNQRATAW